MFDCERHQSVLEFNVCQSHHGRHAAEVAERTGGARTPSHQAHAPPAAAQFHCRLVPTAGQEYVCRAAAATGRSAVCSSIAFHRASSLNVDKELKLDHITAIKSSD